MLLKSFVNTVLIKFNTAISLAIILNIIFCVDNIKAPIIRIEIMFKNKQIHIMIY